MPGRPPGPGSAARWHATIAASPLLTSAPSSWAAFLAPTRVVCVAPRQRSGWCRWTCVYGEVRLCMLGEELLRRTPRRPWRRQGPLRRKRFQPGGRPVDCPGRSKQASRHGRRGARAADRWCLQWTLKFLKRGSKDCFDRAVKYMKRSGSEEGSDFKDNGDPCNLVSQKRDSCITVVRLEICVNVRIVKSVRKAQPL
jgi:hypothetical protein